VFTVPSHRPHIAWVNHPETTPQLLFIRRTTRPSDRFSSHIAFPGGRSEPTDTSHLYTVLRETWEEIGVDLDEREFVNVARLDDREITTSLGKRLLMILSPFGELEHVQ
jgi:8-oxo-dGTP pyrophosphatase MutT (NUDIX family)